MMYIKYLLGLVLICFAQGNASAQNDGIVYENEIYVDYIETVQFGLRANELSLPIIGLDNMSSRLLLEFDDREGGFKNYTYHLLHCDKDWNPSPLEEIEYIDGFNGEEVDDFAYSTNGYSEYTHYEVTLPNDDIKWVISGNYILIIRDADLDIPVLTRRFIVVETQASVQGTMVKPLDLMTIRTNQDMEIALELGDFRVFRPEDEIFVTVMQNGNTNAAYSNLRSNYTKGTALYFDNFNQRVTFPALKEFRFCDIRTLKSRTWTVHSIDQTDNKTTVLMDLGEPRADRHFRTEPDANGAFVIENKDQDGGGKVNGEYVDVVFTLKVERPFLEPVYIVGELSDWRAREKFRMDWDAQSELYTKTVSLKQGYYDYMFAVQQPDGLLAMEVIEGSWYEAENNYQIIVYYRAIGGEYDRVIATSVVKSHSTN